MKRRKFLKNASLTGMGISVGSSLTLKAKQKSKSINDKNMSDKNTLPIVVATWNVPNATQKAMETMQEGGSVLDAVEQGCRVEEADINNRTVGKGGRPDRDGNVTLDASIMNKDGNCGSVVYMQNITHAVTVARSVMEKTPHVILAGRGAENYAVSIGMKRDNLLTEATKNSWKRWLKKKDYKPIINIENHDTIGMLAIDKNNDISGACTTSGLAYKMGGRVGDSPIIGSGLFVDNEVGAAVATGKGEEVLKTVGSFLIVELMRQGFSPQKACEVAIKRIISKPNSDYKNFQVGYIAINKKGNIGNYSIHKGFSITKCHNNENKNIQSDYSYKQ